MEKEDKDTFREEKVLTRRKHLHRYLNNFGTIVVVLFALYIALMPYLPGLLFKIQKQSNKPTLQNSSQTTKMQAKNIPKDNRIVISSALIDQPILEGSNIGVINKGGAWHKKLQGVSPADPGNTVIIGHRFTYTTPNGPFYNLDKVSIGDTIIIYWEGRELLYKVSNISEVEPTAIEIENNTPDRTLTLYTCTPLLTASHRLVVVAKPIERSKR